MMETKTIMLVAAFLAGIILFVIILRVINRLREDRRLAGRRKTTSLRMARVVGAAASEKLDDTAVGVVKIKAVENPPPEPVDDSLAEDIDGESAGGSADDVDDDIADGTANELAGDSTDDSADDPDGKPAGDAQSCGKPVDTAQPEPADTAEDGVEEEETRETQSVSIADVMASDNDEDGPEPAEPAGKVQVQPVGSIHMKPIQPLRTLQPVDGEGAGEKPKAAGININTGRRRMPETVRMKERKVLLVEDVKVNRELVKMYFEGSGVTFDTAENGLEACDMFLGNPDRYSLILMDIQMPVMNGYDAAQRIRSQGIGWAKQIPIIAMTADATDADMGKCFEAGMDDHIAKPIDMEMLQERVFEFIMRDAE